MSDKEIIEKAKKFCEDNNIDNYPVNIVELCEKHGLKVYEEFLPSTVSGFIVVQDEPFDEYGTGKIVAINVRDSANRKRFTIAHELAHFILHRSKNSALYAHRDTGEKSGIEREANLFASNILMPENLVKSALERLRNKLIIDPLSPILIEFVSNEFAVSPAAAEARLRQMNQIL